MPNRKGKVVRIQPVGGLGNQLFQVFAASKFGQTSNAHAVEILRPIPKSPLAIESFTLHEPIRISDITFARSVDYYLKSGINGRLAWDPVGRILGLYSQPDGKSTPLPNWAFSKKNLYLQGYFQSWRFLPDDVSSLTLKIESSWLEAMTAELLSQTPIAIHVRLGDYHEAKSVFGMLSPKYYVDAIEALGVEGTDRPIWVFSDQVELAKKMLGPTISNRNVKWVEEPITHDPAESMVLMSRAKYIIIANSTFSWWAAFLGDTDKKVCFPSPWYQAKTSPEELTPKSWIQVDADWLL